MCSQRESTPCMTGVCPAKPTGTGVSTYEPSQSRKGGVESCSEGVFVLCVHACVCVCLSPMCVWLCAHCWLLRADFLFVFVYYICRYVLHMQVEHS